VAVADQAAEQEVQVEQVLQEQSSSIGSLNGSMYAILENGIVAGYTFDDVKKHLPQYTYVLMTVDNSPAFVGGKYFNGKFLEMEG
jgi:hypothetical protein